MKKDRRKLNIGITYGDPSGIGPEILVKTLHSWNKLKFKNINPVIIGSIDYLKNKLNLKKKSDNYYNEKIKSIKCKSGKPSFATGKYSYECLQYAVSLAKEGKIDALLTCPVSKSTVSLYKKNFKGQTDELARLYKISTEKVIMLFVSSDLRIALFTRHIPVKDISSRLRKEKLKNHILLLNSEIKKLFKVKNPKIAILGLNPHAGENGLIGNEEKNIISPVVKDLCSRGIKVFGPFSPDAILAKAGQNYLKNKKQNYDVYISMYHDQSLPLFKATAGYKGLNITLGLPILRVSPDHGTAFDIAGKNIANNDSLISAFKFLSDT